MVFSAPLCQAQTFRVSGKITNNRLEPLALVSIQVKGTPVGTVSKEDGAYSLELEEGNYDLVFSMVGYRAQVINLTVRANYVQNIIMETADSKDLSGVAVSGKARDRSEEIIRNVIRNKEKLLAAPGAYSYTAYIRAVQEDSLPPRGRSRRPGVDTLQVNREFDKMSMAEITLHYDHETDSKTKEERTGVVRRGNPDGLFFLSLTEGDFNLYNNLIRTSISQVPFISPVSYSGLAAYRYKVAAIRQLGNRKAYTITIRPRQLSNVTVEGEITVLDSLWVIVSASYRLPGFHIPEYDRLEVSQEYNFVNDTAWMITRQQFHYFSRHGRGKLSGSTVVSYSDFRFNQTFPRKYFGTEISATAKEAYERDSSFWKQARAVPLSSREIRFIQYKDSLLRITTSKAYLDSIDRLTNRLTLGKVFLFGLTKYNREKKRSWYFPPISGMYEPFEFGGSRVNLYTWHNKEYASKKALSVYADLSYGFRNRDINGNINLTKMYNPFNRAFYRVELKRDFQYIYEGDAWINMIKRNNYYLDNAISLGHGQEIVNGLFLFTDLDLAFRRSLSGYKTGHKIDSLINDIFTNEAGDNRAPSFDPYNALYGKIRLQYTPGQKYIREPKEKIILGSRWPTFYAMWRKGIPGLASSKVDFDYLEFGIEQELKLGTSGVSHYTIKSGSFLNTRDLRLIDYQFQRRGDPFLFLNPSEAFQSLDSTFPLFHRFYQGHYIHEFNGAILNKIPLLKKLQLREIAGGGFLLAPERNLRYAELFAGIERVFKWPFNPLYKLKIGVYLVGSAANQFRNPIQFKIGVMSWDRKKNKWM
jgi:hypothetical protein